MAKGAEEKLKELTGTVILSDSFINLLNENDLTAQDGYKIQNQLKKEIDDGKLDSLGIEMRLIQLVREYSNSSKGNSESKVIVCPRCNHIELDSNGVCDNCGYNFITKEVPLSKEVSEFKEKRSFLANFDFNVKTCPDCQSKLLKTDDFCFNCGSRF